METSRRRELIIRWHGVCVTRHEAARLRHVHARFGPQACFGRILAWGSAGANRQTTVASSRRPLRHSTLFRLLARAGLWLQRVPVPHCDVRTIVAGARWDFQSLLWGVLDAPPDQTVIVGLGRTKTADGGTQVSHARQTEIESQ
jgi:hypothetical protein